MIGRSRNLGSRARPLVRRHWRLLVAASAALARARGTLLLLPFERAIRHGSVPLSSRGEGGSVFEIVWAVQAVGRRLPFRTMCIEQGLAAQRLLRRTGVDARLHYGARQAADALEAHVWVSVDGTTLIGGEEASGFALIATYPE